MYPMSADIYYPTIQQGGYGNISKTWILDKTIVGSFTPAGSAIKEEVIPNVNVTQDKILLGRVKSDLRISDIEEANAITNIVVSNIRDRSSNEIYIETSGPRAGKSTIFEVASQEPHIGPYGSIDFYSVILRRSENQGVDV